MTQWWSIAYHHYIIIKFTVDAATCLEDTAHFKSAKFTQARFWMERKGSSLSAKNDFYSNTKQCNIMLILIYFSEVG